MKKNEDEPKRILIVEDHKEIALVVEKRLSKLFTVQVAFNGEDASDMLLANEYDLVILDLSLPKKSGFESQDRDPLWMPRLAPKRRCSI